ncbi:multi-sensor signal transduction histidine kinase [Calothrix sp. NIES-4071]|nr:multi-sensor signal transduction histidine kinase [Calothrix sp. NIES-4071]BAZ59962.1 multi-sensor signal transduction histidine kinase [Calothrix sp. NIES-4105]
MTSTISQEQNYNYIHIPGAIQPHGVLIALSLSLQIEQVSDNVEEFLSKKPEDLLNQPLHNLFGAEEIRAIEDLLVSTQHASISPNYLKLTLNTPEGEKHFDATVHKSDRIIILELEPTLSRTEMSFVNFRSMIGDVIPQIQQTSKLSDFTRLVVDKVKDITGFDRVMIFRFDASGAGSVIAEAKQEELEPYLGLHYPESDIPEPARKLYARGLLRYIPDLNAHKSNLIPLNNPYTAQPLDLSDATLRSCDDCCVQYHQNMGVSALLVISLIQDQKLWGLISCHNSTPKYLTSDIRTGCGFLGQIVSLELSNQIITEELDYKDKLKLLLSQFVASISSADNFIDALIHPKPCLLDLVTAGGCAISLDNEITLVGATPGVEEVRSLIEWSQNTIDDDLFATDSLPKIYPLAQAFKDFASGLLVLRISRIRRFYILWFRPEVIQTVNWAGAPEPLYQVTDEGNLKPSPRKSFELWKGTVLLTSSPWLQCELDSAIDLRNALVGIVLNKTDELAKINLELQRSNQELDSFAYAASHDLKEPLRGIHNYSNILIEDYAHLLDAEGLEYLNTLVNLTQRMDTLINVLLRLSQIGQTELRKQFVDLNDLLNIVISMFRASRQGENFDIRIPKQLPVIECDPVLVNELFTNLISNAFKYNDQAHKWVEIGYLEEQIQKSVDTTSFVFYVKDNGIGIQPQHQELIFRLFKRLHSKEKYGGGTGAGLAIAKKILQRHGGKIWVESTYGQGSTFFFIL